jgi:helix-turn-helix protein/regulatory GntR family protein
MIDDTRGLPKWARVAAAVRGQIADGTLRAGQPAPSGAALSRVTGYSTLTCRRALRVLVADGVLTPGPSRNARPRVAGAGQPRAERDLAVAARALSAGLAARRRASGLTQPGLARHACVSVTTVGHAETGRLWQSRRFWERVDAVLGAHGELLRLHDAYREAAAANGAGVLAPANPGTTGEAAMSAGDAAGGYGQARPASVTIVWGNGRVTTVHAPEAS